MGSQPTFFEIETRREELEKRLRAESLPIALVKKARETVEVYPFFYSADVLYRSEEEPHLQGVIKSRYQEAIERLARIRDEKPWLIELSERFIDTFQATFVGNGYRCMQGCEGLNFLDGIGEIKNPYHWVSAVQLPPDKERDFVKSIENVSYLGLLPTFETEMIDGKRISYSDFNGWGSHTEAFMFTFKNRNPMVGYLNRGFTGDPYNGEAWILFSERKAREYVAQKSAA